MVERSVDMLELDNGSVGADIFVISLPLGFCRQMYMQGDVPACRNSWGLWRRKMGAQERVYDRMHRVQGIDVSNPKPMTVNHGS